MLSCRDGKRFGAFTWIRVVIVTLLLVSSGKLCHFTHGIEPRASLNVATMRQASVTSGNRSPAVHVLASPLTGSSVLVPSDGRARMVANQALSGSRRKVYTSSSSSSAVKCAYPEEEIRTAFFATQVTQRSIRV